MDKELLDILQDLGQPIPDDDTDDTVPTPEGDTTETNSDDGDTNSDVDTTEGDGNTDDSDDTDSSSVPPIDNKVNKQNQVFAQMRVQNKQYQKTIESLGKLLGANSTDPDELLNLVQNKIVSAQARQQGVPEELLRELHALKQESEITKQERLYQQGLQGFQKVKDTYGLNNKEIEEFAAALSQQGINPFAQTVDMMAQYKQINFEKIVAKEVEKAVQAERERIEHAKSHSVNPSKKVGAAPDDSDGPKVGSQADFNNWLDNLK